jgi:hypothetical protein
MRGSRVRKLTLFYSRHNANYAEYVNQYATNIHADADEGEDESDGELSEVEDFDSDGDDEPAGAMEDV